MNPVSRFIVLIERRRLREALISGLVLMALVAGTAGPRLAHAKPLAGHEPRKVARDLDDELTEVRQPKAKWARDLKGVRHVQVVIVSNASDPEMADLRAYVRSIGGAVHALHPAVHAMTVQLKARHVAALSQRSDVVSVSPNRITQQTASTLESITGSMTNNVRNYSSQSSYSGVDGTGIGIAVLDSGVMKQHHAFGDRVKRNVNVINASLANWATGGGSATSLMPGSSELGSYEAAIANDTANVQDPYGHGTHVASVAAGRYYDPRDPAAQDLSGVAPNANLYDVRVLGDSGSGTLSDALAGIQWVIFHAKEYNIRVLNVSLAASSTESWQTDPLCVAVRSATAAGITVVVAAGNFGQTTTGSEIYGRIGSPGNDPSVITVGAVNFKGTTSRNDDSVNLFSSRGPTRGTSVDVSGVRRVDNLLKPDLVAPGNKIIGAAATASNALNWNLLATNNWNSLVAPLDCPWCSRQAPPIL